MEEAYFNNKAIGSAPGERTKTQGVFSFTSAKTCDSRNTHEDVSELYCLPKPLARWTNSGTDSKGFTYVKLPETAFWTGGGADDLLG